MTPMMINDGAIIKDCNAKITVLRKLIFRIRIKTEQRIDSIYDFQELKRFPDKFLRAT